jgi:4'-phosphopantetheinyl transferase
MTHVLVLHARLTAGPDSAALAPLLARLPYAKRLELEGRDPQSRHASLAGIALVLRGIEALRGGPAAAGQLQFPTGGKPCVPGGPGFNVSHGGQRVAAALCLDVEVGFDLEEFDPSSIEPCAAQARLD